MSQNECAPVTGKIGGSLLKVRHRYGTYKATQIVFFSSTQATNFTQASVTLSVSTTHSIMNKHIKALFLVLTGMSSF